MFICRNPEDEQWAANWREAYGHCRSLPELVKQSAINCARTTIKDKRLFQSSIAVRNRGHRHQFKSLEEIAKW